MLIYLDSENTYEHYVGCYSMGISVLVEASLTVAVTPQRCISRCEEGMSGKIQYVIYMTNLPISIQLNTYHIFLMFFMF